MEIILFLLAFSMIGIVGIIIIMWGYKLQEYNLIKSRKAIKLYGDMWLYGSLAKFNARIYSSKYYPFLIKGVGIYFIAFSILGITLILQIIN